ncbi:hypothetical protein BASA62_003631 [Batrachochytrium salamandrivorans]|nr:hypothetical protein BASA62_003631 [Batrachochytrium salamandrivorans]
MPSCESSFLEVTCSDVAKALGRSQIYHLFVSFERDPRIGGACGEIAAELGPSCGNLLNPLVATQNFEYQMSISLISLSSQSLVIFRRDRIFALNSSPRKHEAWILKYVKSAVAETDVPSTLPELISQRRRWLNGPFFASVHAISNFSQIFQSPHSSIQKFIFSVEFVYNSINLAFSWTSLPTSILLFTFCSKSPTLLTQVSLPFGTHSEIVDLVMRELYILLLSPFLFRHFLIGPRLQMAVLLSLCALFDYHGHDVVHGWLVAFTKQ